MKIRIAVVLGAALAASMAAGAASAQGFDGPRLGMRMGGQGGMDRGGLLRAADADQDGVATRAEIDALQDENFAWRDRNGDGVLDTADLGPVARRLLARRGDDPWASAGRGARLDADGDEQITRADFTAQTDALFTRLDTNSDSAISAEEAAAARRGMPGRDMRFGGPDGPDDQGRGR